MGVRGTRGGSADERKQPGRATSRRHVPPARPSSPLRMASRRYPRYSFPRPYFATDKCAAAPRKSGLPSGRAGSSRALYAGTHPDGRTSVLLGMAAHAALIIVGSSQWNVCRVCVERRLPALSSTKTEAGPGNQMADRREAAHVRADCRMRTCAVVSLKPGIVNRRPTAARKGRAHLQWRQPMRAPTSSRLCQRQRPTFDVLRRPTTRLHFRGPCAAQPVAASSRPSSAWPGRHGQCRRAAGRAPPQNRPAVDIGTDEEPNEGPPREGTVGFTSRGATRGAHTLGRVRHASARLLDGLPYGR